MAQIFMSYSHEDSGFAVELANLLEKRGASVFRDSKTKPGDDWQATLRKEIERSVALVLLIPSRSVANRNNVWFEAGAARALGKPVLAVLPPNEKPQRAELPVDIASLLVLDADERPLENIADMLVQAMRSKEDGGGNSKH